MLSETLPRWAKGALGLTTCGVGYSDYFIAVAQPGALRFRSRNQPVDEAGVLVHDFGIETQVKASQRCRAPFEARPERVRFGDHHRASQHRLEFGPSGGPQFTGDQFDPHTFIRWQPLFPSIQQLEDQIVQGPLAAGCLADLAVDPGEVHRTPIVREHADPGVFPEARGNLIVGGGIQGIGEVPRRGRVQVIQKSLLIDHPGPQRQQALIVDRQALAEPL
jgi:hypothetical protein